MCEIKLDKTFVLNDYIYLVVPYSIMWAFTFETAYYDKGVILPYKNGYGEYFDLNMLPGVIKLHILMSFLIVALKAFGATFIINPAPVPLRRKPFHETMKEFISKTNLEFAGMSAHYGPMIRTILHPYDFFMDKLFRKYCDQKRVDAIETYKRTNATLHMRLDQAEKFSKDTIYSPEVRELIDDVFSEITVNVVTDHEFEVQSKKLRRATDGDFAAVRFENTSAAGFPYKAGVKKGDVIDDAMSQAEIMLNNNASFGEYMSSHVWYTTGRAKLQEVFKEPSARIVCYPGFAVMLLSCLYLQWWQGIMECYAWCAVGMSWTDGGARKLAEFFGDVKGHAPAGYRYVSLDISGFDNSLGSYFMGQLRNFHLGIMEKAGVSSRYVTRMISIINDMIYAIITFPLGYAFKTNCGMKSGWPNTSHDDTLFHFVVMRIVEKMSGFDLKYKLYGDDNLMLVPNELTDEEIIKIYSMCGLKVKDFKSSTILFEVPFLSKRIRYVDGEYYVFREEVETFSRLLMPEEGDPRERSMPDEVVAAERLIGHLFDNPFNKAVRSHIYEMLKHLRDHYKVYNIDISDFMRKNMRWRNVDIDRLKSVPIIPDFDFIENLYGVKGMKLSFDWPDFKPWLQVFDYSSQAPNAVQFYDAQSIYFASWNYVLDLSKKKRKICAKATSPFTSIPSSYNVRGFHAARLEWAIKRFNIHFERVLDFGTHPGACANALLRRRNTYVKGVSLVPSFDKQKCPMVLRDRNFEFSEMDVNDYIFDEHFDLLHDDVDVVSTRSVYDRLESALQCLTRFIRGSKHVDQALMTVSEINAEVIDLMYECYRHFGGFDIAKPLYSNPWKPEYMIYFYKDRGRALIRKKSFQRAVYAYLNTFASEIVRWSSVLKDNAERLRVGKEVYVCPNQKDEGLQRSYIDNIL